MDITLRLLRDYLSVPPTVQTVKLGEGLTLYRPLHYVSCAITHCDLVNAVRIVATTLFVAAPHCTSEQ